MSWEARHFHQRFLEFYKKAIKLFWSIVKKDWLVSKFEMTNEHFILTSSSFLVKIPSRESQGSQFKTCCFNMLKQNSEIVLRECWLKPLKIEQPNFEEKLAFVCLTIMSQENLFSLQDIVEMTLYQFFARNLIDRTWLPLRLTMVSNILVKTNFPTSIALRERF